MLEVVTASISALATLTVCLITNNSNQKRTEALIEYKLNQLTEKVNKHNCLIERTYKLEEQTALLTEKISVANHRIDDLERGGGHSE